MSLFDQMGNLAARRGFPAAAALLLGFADRGYAATQDRRHGIAARAEGEAWRHIVEALGDAESARQRTAGAALSEDDARAQARTALENS